MVLLGASQRRYKLDCAKLWVKGGVAEQQRSVSIHGTQFLQSNPMFFFRISANALILIY